MVLQVLQVLLEALALLGALVGLGSIKPKEQTVQTVRLLLVAQTIIMWHQDILMPPEPIIIITIRRDTLTVMGIS
jgi:hypothetical protein